ncbi:MAG: Ni Fe-hydrogenase III large subunit, partial [Gammaproteobacteria bacterium]|nr:Ni Fe-hydrogenase III large subunit [Gammaproteobacteria bacterium]
MRRLKKTPLLKARTSGIGHLADSDILCGIVARSTGIKKDVRSDDEHYISLGFKALHRNEGDAWARLQLRLDEMRQSLSLIEAAGAIEL